MVNIKELKIGVAGLGAMGAGIAEVAVLAGHNVYLWDSRPVSFQVKNDILKNLNKLATKGIISDESAKEAESRIFPIDTIEGFRSCGLVIEAIIEDSSAKRDLFTRLEEVCSENTIISSNTSSLSIASLGAALKKPERCIGIHFFNPATRMPLVEIIPSVATDAEIPDKVVQLIQSWGKITVLAMDTPGFIVNRIARPFYGEAIRMVEEGLATIDEVDKSMKELGGFKMGPFELMDFIGHDVNFRVTESVFREFWFDPRYKPSFLQKRLFEAGRLGRKSGKGFYEYDNEGKKIEKNEKQFEPSEDILKRILAMLINEAADALYMGIASAKDIDLAMTKGVNYPKGLLAWADEWGVEGVVAELKRLQTLYGEDRYRPSALFSILKGPISLWTR
jgi:3-hydroxybutyryl-CoA dehydrogenase